MKLFFVAPSIVPHVKLKEVDRLNLKLTADSFGLLPHVVCGKDILIGMTSWPRPSSIQGCDLRGRVEATLPVVTGTAAEKFAEQAVCFAITISPRRVEEVAAKICRELQGLSRLLIVGVRPAAHTPQSLGNLADLEINSSKLAKFHRSPCA